MTTWNSANHPQRRLLFFIEQDFEQDDDDTIGKKVKDMVDSLASSRSWVIHPPEFFDSDLEHDSNVASPERTLGGYIDIYSALPGTNLPREIDRKHLEEVEYLVESVCRFSKANELIIAFELGRTFVGTIEDGVVDETLGEGLLGEWRRNLDASL